MGPAPRSLSQISAILLSHSKRDGECLIWTGHILPNGYGQLQMAGKKKYVHRLAYELYIGQIPKGQFICHICDRKPCIEPAHLRAWTHDENMADARNKGRMPSGDRNGSRVHPESRPRGERHGLRLHPERVARGDRHGTRTHPASKACGERQGGSKLTEAQVRTIQQVYRLGGISQKSLAKRFGVCQMTVCRITRGETWKHLDAAAPRF